MTIFLPALWVNVLRRVTLIPRALRRRRLAFFVSLTVAVLVPACVSLVLPLPITTGLAAAIFSFLAALRAISNSNFAPHAVVQSKRTGRPFLTTRPSLVLAIENEAASA